LHSGEHKTERQEDTEMLNFQPERLGHCVYYNSNSLNLLKQSRIPVEICLTCHQKYFKLSYLQNPFYYLYYNLFMPTSKTTTTTTTPTSLISSSSSSSSSQRENSAYPLILCTDNPTLLETTLSNEYKIAIEQYNFTMIEILNFVKNSINYIFADENSKKHLKEKFDKKREEIRQKWI